MPNENLTEFQKDIIALTEKHSELRFFIATVDNNTHQVAFAGNECPRCVFNFMVHWMIEHGVRHNCDSENISNMSVN